MNQHQNGQSRREALRNIALGTSAVTAFPILGQARGGNMDAAMPGMAAAGAAAQTSGPRQPLFFDQHQNQMVEELTELIIPATDTPGAKAAQVNRLSDLFLNEEPPATQERFVKGLSWIDGRSLERHGKSFVELTAEQQAAMLQPLANEQNKAPEDQPGVEFFEELKGWTIEGYYSSQIGCQQELGYSGWDYHAEFPAACNHPEHQK